MSAVDAVVVALAATRPDGVVVTTDAVHLRALARHAAVPVSIVAA